MGGGGGANLSPCWFSLNKSERVNLKPWHFAAFSNILLGTFVPNLVLLTHPGLLILVKTKTEVFAISGFWSISYKGKLS